MFEVVHRLSIQLPQLFESLISLLVPNIIIFLQFD